MQYPQPGYLSRSQLQHLNQSRQPILPSVPESTSSNNLPQLPTPLAFSTLNNNCSQRQSTFSSSGTPYYQPQPYPPSTSSFEPNFGSYQRSGGYSIQTGTRQNNYLGTESLPTTASTTLAPGNTLRYGTLSTRTVDRYGFVGGGQFSDVNVMDASVTVEKIRAREAKWLKMFTYWDRFMAREFDTVRRRCRKGIPPAVRSRAWQYLCGSRKLIYENRSIYQTLLNNPGDPDVIDQIQKDVTRQYPQHEDFSAENGYGQRALFNLLKAYSVAHPKAGYCQAHAPIAAALLIHMPEEEAFWTFFRICDRYMPGYYDPGLERVQVDAKVLLVLVQRYLPQVHKHLLRFDISPLHFMVDWFMCLFTRNLPWATVVRILDQFFCEGMKVIFRFALAILKSVLGTSQQRHEHNSMEATLTLLRNLPPDVTAEAVLVNQAMHFTRIRPEEFEKDHRKVWQEWRESQSTRPHSHS